MEKNINKEYWNTIYKRNNLAEIDASQAVCNPELSSFVNNILNKFHIKSFKNLLNSIPKSIKLKVLDLGCGKGRWCHRLYEDGYTTYGLDLSFNALKNNKNKDKHNFINGSIGNIPSADNSFDLISNITVLQHVTNSLQQATLDEIERVLKPNGYWIFMEHICVDENTKWEGVYPQTINTWVDNIESRGFTILKKERFQYIPITQQTINMFRFIENFIHNIRNTSSKKNINIENSESTNSISLSKERILSKKIKFYRYVTNKIVNCVILLDFVLEKLFGKKNGSHIAILAVKSASKK